MGPVGHAAGVEGDAQRRFRIREGGQQKDQAVAADEQPAQLQRR